MRPDDHHYLDKVSPSLSGALPNVGQSVLYASNKYTESDCFKYNI